MGLTKVMESTGSFDYIALSGSNVAFVQGFTYSTTAERIDSTTIDTSGDGKEFKDGRVERIFSINVLMDVSSSDLTTVTAQPIEISFGGKRYLGTGSIYNMQSEGTIDDLYKQSYDGAFNGAVFIKTASEA